ncbi:MAG: alcohol dehydrogenase catalytic domain-containing protein [Dermatophilaceae bacterium]
MRAVSYPAYGVLPEVVEVPDPVCPDGGVLVRVAATGVCRSDWHAWTGHDPVPLPMVPGHEFAGVLAEVGLGVTRWRVGDRVTVPFACGCGDCAVCRAGDTHVCPNQTQPGFTGWGSFAELVAIHAADVNVVRLPDEVSFRDGAALGCRFATAYRGVATLGQVGPGQWLAVHGCGGVGLSAVLVGVALGARVVAVDVSEPALMLARELGCEATVLGGDDVVEQVRAVTDGGAHVSVDAVGSAATMQASVACLRPRGRHVQLGLLLGADAQAPVPMGAVIARELTVLGGHGMPARDYLPMLSSVAAGQLTPGRLVGRVIELAQAGAALAGLGAEPSGAGITVVEVGRPE